MKKNNARQINNKGSNEFSDKSQAYLYVHAHALFSSLGRLVRSPFSTVMTITVMAIAISLAAGFYLFVVNMQQLTGNLEASNQISLFLKTNISNAEGEKLASELRKNSNLEQVMLISKERALEEFKAYSGFGDALSILKINPLPTVIQVLPKNTLNDLQSVEQLMAGFNKLPQLDFAQMDMQWIERLHSMMQIVQRGVFLLTILLSSAVIFITGNSIRLELQNRRDEVMVAKLVGATSAFIQRPFIYTGFWLGFISGVLAWVLVTIMMIVLQGPIERLSVLYDGAFDVSYLGLGDTAWLLFLSSALGVIGAWSVLHYQLKAIKPE